MSNESKEENPYIFQSSSESMERVKPRALLDRASLVEKDVERAMSSIAEDERFNKILYRERLLEEAARESRDTRMRVLALFVGGILFGASTIGICVIGPTATAWTLPLVSTLGCFAVSLGLILMGSIKSL